MWTTLSICMASGCTRHRQTEGRAVSRSPLFLHAWIGSWESKQKAACCLELDQARRIFPGDNFLGLVPHILLPATQNPYPTHPQPRKHQVLQFVVFFAFPPHILYFPGPQAACFKFNNPHNSMDNCEPRWFLLVTPLEPTNLKCMLYLAKS